MHTTRPRRLMLTFALLAPAFAGCAPASTRSDTSSAPIASSESSGASQDTTTVAAPATATAHTTLTRALIEQTVAQGLGAFLSRVSVAPVLDGRRFVGFRLESAEDLETWRAAGADLRVGDVIQRINGQTIERPEQAMWAFNQLRIARGVEVVGVRGSAPFRVYSPIVDAQ
jgi:type II secretory pathway component PulC